MDQSGRCRIGPWFNVASAAEHDAGAAVGVNIARERRMGLAIPGSVASTSSRRPLKPTLRQVHVAGERMFVDFAGQTMDVLDGATGEVRQAAVFVAVLGASSYTYAEAVWSQSLPD